MLILDLLRLHDCVRSRQRPSLSFIQRSMILQKSQITMTLPMSIDTPLPVPVSFILLFIVQSAILEGVEGRR